MKKTILKRKLVLSSTTVRDLSTQELAHLAGGALTLKTCTAICTDPCSDSCRNCTQLC
jgi:hypothetical protein